MSTAACNGVEIHYERLGSGPRLLYCNGSGATLDSVRPLLGLLASRFDVLAFDYRGMGASAPVVEPYTMGDLAVDVAALLDAVGWERTALAGLSFGGMVAQEFAVTFPQRVERLALLATSPGGVHASFPLEQLADLSPADRARESILLADRRWTPDWLAVHPGQGALAAGFTAARDGDETVEQSRGRILQLQARTGHDVLDRLHRISCPTLVGSGRYDDIAPVANGQAMVDRIPGAELHIYDGGHAFLLQDPAAWPELVAFLDPV
jgi:pimeloyl-ACP methyl ester carboxylesterase